MRIGETIVQCGIFTLIVYGAVTTLGCDARDTCRMNADNLGIRADACDDPAVAEKAVKVLEQQKKNARSDAEKKLDTMLSDKDPPGCSHGYMAELAAKLRQQLNECEARKGISQTCDCNPKAEIEEGDWRNPK